MMEWRWEFLQRIRKVFYSYDIGWITTPTLERTELFTRSVGETTDIVEKEMYTFKDRGGRLVTLRPEGTAPVVRALIEHNLIPPIRLGYYMNNFRAERPQKGRLREFWQVGVEFVGYAHPLSDVLLIRIGVEILKAAGVSQWQLEIHTLGQPEERQRYTQILIQYLEPQKDRLCKDCQRRIHTNPLRVLDCKRDAPQLKDIPRLQDFLGADSQTFYETVKEGLVREGIPFKENPNLVRGLDYYTHTVFEFKAQGLGAQNAVGGGGRYNGLVELLGGASTPASGFAFGVERLYLASQTPSPALPPLIVVLGVAPEDLDDAYRVARHITGGPWRVHFYPESRSLRVRMRMAHRMGARWVILMGEEERQTQSARIRDMEHGTEQVVAQSQLRETLEHNLP